MGSKVRIIGGSTTGLVLAVGSGTSDSGEVEGDGDVDGSAAFTAFSVVTLLFCQLF
jgi:hypothetical protein